MVSGLVKDFLERIYPWFEEVPNRNPGLPYLLISKGGNDGTGAVRDVTRIVTGLRWKEALPPIVVTGSVTDEHLAQVREQAATLAAGVDSRRVLTNRLAASRRRPAGSLDVSRRARRHRPRRHVLGPRPPRWRPPVLAAVAELERRGVPLARRHRPPPGLDPRAARRGRAGPAGRHAQRRARPRPRHPRSVPPGAVPGRRRRWPPTTRFVSVGAQPGRLRRRPPLRRVHQRVARAPTPPTCRRWATPRASARAPTASAVDDLRAAVAESPVLGFSMIGVPFDAAEAAFAALHRSSRSTSTARSTTRVWRR